MADPDFELRWGPAFILMAQLAFLPSVISSFFTQNKGAQAPRAPPLDPPLQCTKYGVALYAQRLNVKQNTDLITIR